MEHKNHNPLSIVLPEITKESLEKEMKKMLDRLNDPDYLDALDRIDQIISQQNPNLN